MFERQSRFDVLLNGVKVSQLYFNMTGYVGTLPLPGGRTLGMPEAGISVWRRTVAKINRGVIE